VARGRLIFPFRVDLAQLDTEATQADPDGAGPLLSGYDDEFREPVIVPPTAGSARGVSARAETIIRCPVQIEDDDMEKLQMFASGNSPESPVTLVFHFKELERNGFVDAVSGEALIRVNDRLHAIYTRRDVLVQMVRNPPGLFCTEAKPRSFGLSTQSSSRNLLVCKFEARDLSVRG